MNSNATSNVEGLTNDREHHRGTEMIREMYRISVVIGIVEDLNNVFAVIFLRGVSGGMVCGVGTYGCVKVGGRCLTYAVNDIFYVHFPRRRGLVESVFVGGIRETGNHKYEARHNSD